MTTAGTVTWSTTEPPARVSDVAELDSVLDRITASVRSGRPIIATLVAHGTEVLVGIGCAQSFVQLSPVSGDGPYVVTAVAAAAGSGVVEFWLHGSHHTEIPVRNLVPTSAARAAVREFLASGSRYSGVAWGELEP